MPIVNEFQVRTFDDWVFRWRPSGSSPGRLLLLLHGWKGSEDSMWVFTRDLPRDYALLAPRAPHADPEGGYTWRALTEGAWGFPALSDLQPAADALLSFLDSWSVSAGIDADEFDLMGFSQGAALALTLSVLHPGRIRSLAVLSGFLPAGAETLLERQPFIGKAIFVAHGTKDELVPVERARSAVTQLERAGARITYCESQAGHKVSKECFGAIASFFGSSA